MNLLLMLIMQLTLLQISAIIEIATHNSQQIFIRIENTANSTCAHTGTHVTLAVDSTPLANVVQDLNICDNSNGDGDDTNGFVQSIEIEVKLPEFRGTQNPADNHRTLSRICR